MNCQPQRMSITRVSHHVNIEGHQVAPSPVLGGRSPASLLTLAGRVLNGRDWCGVQWERTSRDTPEVFGPRIPIAKATTAIEAAINAKTPTVPKSFNSAAITKPTKIPLSLLQL